jgi:aminoglycoside phosphotransferase (APT) family kinase protein
MTMLEKLAQKIDPQSKFLRAWPLTGGVSAQVMAIEIARADGQTQKMIARRHGDADFENNPGVAADELKLMQILKDAGVAVPAPLYLDDSGDIFDRPAIVIEFIDGKTEFSPTNLDDMMRQMAVSLVKIHCVDCAYLDFLPQHTFEALSENFDDSFDVRRIREILESAPRGNPHGLLHGDFWPGNVLWRDGQLAAVIDWEDAALGDPLIDLANGRLEILWALGAEAMENFTRQYQAANAIDLSGLPYWDLRVALRNVEKIGGWGLEVGVEKRMRDELRWLMAQAVENLT